MSENVVALKRGTQIANARREAFLQAVSASFDHYVEKQGHEPDAVVYVLCGLKQTSSIGWHVTGDSEGGATSVLSMAAVHCLTEAGRG